VIISTAHGLKFTDFKVKYHENKLEEVESKYANTPIELPPEYDKVQKTIIDKISDFS